MVKKKETKPVEKENEIRQLKGDINSLKSRLDKTIPSVDLLKTKVKDFEKKFLNIKNSFKTYIIVNSIAMVLLATAIIIKFIF